MSMHFFFEISLCLPNMINGPVFSLAIMHPEHLCIDQALKKHIYNYHLTNSSYLRNQSCFPLVMCLEFLKTVNN